jgi:hypothetical protein
MMPESSLEDLDLVGRLDRAGRRPSKRGETAQPFLPHRSPPRREAILRKICTSTLAAIPGALLLGLLVFAAGAAHADLTGYTLERLAFEGDADPVAGTLNQMVGEVDLDEDGRVTFVSYVWDGVDLRNKIFAVVNGALGVEVSVDDVAPGTGGLLFSDIGRPRIAASGVLAYVGLYEDGLDTRWGGFLRNGASHSVIASTGTPAPGGGSISKVLFIHDVTAAASVLFGAEVDAGGVSPIGAHFVHETGGLREIYRDGQAAPAAVGGTFSGVQPWWFPALAPDGTVTFYADVSGGSVAKGLFQASPAGVVAPVLLAGDAVTTPGGGTFTDFFQFAGTNAAGDLVVAGFVQRPPLLYDPQAVFVLEGGVQRELVFRGDPIPGTSPARFFLQLGGNGPPALNTAGTVAFAASLTDELENTFERALLVDRAGTLGALVKEGDPVPGMAGATFTEFLDVRLAEDGSVAFTGYTTAGIGIFRATPPASAVHAVPPLGIALLAAALTAVAVAAAKGRSRRS